MKKTIAVVLSLMITLSIFAALPLSADAYLDFEFGESGCVGNYEERPEFAYNDPKDGTNLTYTFDEASGTLTLIPHTDVSPDCSMGINIFKGQTKIKHLIVNEGVTGLYKGAFSDCTNLEDVKLPSTLTKIEGDLFSNCISLKEVTLKGNISTIYDYAFYNCSSLSSVTLNDKLEVIENGAFEECGKLGEITFPKSLKEISAYAFSSCYGLKKAVFKDSPAKIGNGSFLDCKALETVDFGSSLKELFVNCFYNCSALKSVNIPGVVTT